MASIIKVNDIQNTSGANIINESSNTITIGASGDTVSLAAGATYDLGGGVQWETTPKTADFNAGAGEGYFVDTSSNTDLQPCVASMNTNLTFVLLTFKTASDSAVSILLEFLATVKLLLANVPA